MYQHFLEASHKLSVNESKCVEDTVKEISERAIVGLNNFFTAPGAILSSEVVVAGEADSFFGIIEGIWFPEKDAHSSWVVRTEVR